MFLLIVKLIVMIVLIYDACDDLVAAIGDEAQDVHEFVFADDTLIVDETSKYAEVHMHLHPTSRSVLWLIIELG